MPRRMPTLPSSHLNRDMPRRMSRRSGRGARLPSGPWVPRRPQTLCMGDEHGRRANSEEHEVRGYI